MVIVDSLDDELAAAVSNIITSVGFTPSEFIVYPPTTGGDVPIG